MSIMISLIFPSSSPTELRTPSPVSVLAERTLRYLFSGSVFLILSVALIFSYFLPVLVATFGATGTRSRSRALGAGRHASLPIKPGSTNHATQRRCKICKALRSFNFGERESARSGRSSELSCNQGEGSNLGFTRNVTQGIENEPRPFQNLPPQYLGLV